MLSCKGSRKSTWEECRGQLLTLGTGKMESHPDRKKKAMRSAPYSAAAKQSAAKPKTPTTREARPFGSVPNLGEGGGATGEMLSQALAIRKRLYGRERFEKAWRAVKMQ